jgi:dsDNA-specific endonuclease/ATPase MutS2
VVHGKGSGRIRDALHRELAALPVVASFRLDPQNAGVTWVYL